MTGTIHERCIGLMGEQLGLGADDLSTVDLDAGMIDTYVLDSLDIVELVMAAEEEFEIDLPDGVFEDGTGDITLRHCEAVIESHLKRKEAAADRG